MPQEKTKYVYKGNKAYMSLNPIQKQLFEDYLSSYRYIYNKGLQYLIDQDEKKLDLPTKTLFINKTVNLSTIR